MHLIPKECPRKQTEAMPGQPEVSMPGVKMVASAPAGGSGWEREQSPALSFTGRDPPCLHWHLDWAWKAS